MGITEKEKVCLWVVIRDSLLINRLGVPLILVTSSSYIFDLHLYQILKEQLVMKQTRETPIFKSFEKS